MDLHIHNRSVINNVINNRNPAPAQQFGGTARTGGQQVATPTPSVASSHGTSQPDVADQHNHRSASAAPIGTDAGAGACHRQSGTGGADTAATAAPYRRAAVLR